MGKIQNEKLLKCKKIVVSLSERDEKHLPEGMFDVYFNAIVIRLRGIIHEIMLMESVSYPDLRLLIATPNTAESTIDKVLLGPPGDVELGDLIPVLTALNIELVIEKTSPKPKKGRRKKTKDVSED